MSDSVTTTLHEYVILATGVPSTPELLNGLRSLYVSTGDYTVVDSAVNTSIASQAATMEEVYNQVVRIAQNGLGLALDHSQAVEVTNQLVANGIDSWSEVFSFCSGLENQYGATLNNRAMVAEAFTASLDTPEEAAAFATPAGQFTMAAWLGGVTENLFSRGMAQALLGDTLRDLLNPTQGAAQDGYLSGAQVFIDANHNGVLDDGEFATITDATGNYTLPAGVSGSIVAFGGTDIATQLAFHGSFIAPAGSMVVSPLTTLMVGLMEQGHSQAVAQDVLRSRLGLPDVDLASFDPIAELSGDNSGQARAVLTAAVQVNNLLTIGGSALEGANTTLDAATAFGRMTEALVQQLDGARGVVDLAGNSLVQNVLSDAADAGNVILGASLIREIAQMAANHNTAIVGLGSLEGDALLSRVMAIATVSQGAAAEAVQAASTQGDASFGTVMGDYTFEVVDQTPVVPAPVLTPTPTPDPPPADTTPPVTTTPAAVSGTTAFATTLAATINENGTGYYLVQAATDPFPSAATVIAANHSFTMAATTQATANISGLSSSTAYTVYFVATDTAGNVQGSVGSVAVTTLFPPDSTAPDAPIGLSMAAEDDTGSSNSDGVTMNTAGLTINGIAEADSTVRLYDTDGATLLGTGTATGGVFSIDVSLAEGGHTITVKATDAANNTSIASTGLAVTVDTTAPTTTITSGDYNSSTNILTITGAAFDTLLSSGETGATDIKDRLDWSKLVWDINGDNAVTANVGFALGSISSALATNGTTLTVTLTDAAAAALEATGGYGGAGGADTLDGAAGFCRDKAGNAATTDGVADGSIATSHAGDAVIDLGSSGLLIAPVQVEGHTYYYWDRSGDGTAAPIGTLNGGVDGCTLDMLYAIFTTDGNGNPRYATINGVDIALPTVGGQSFPPYGAEGMNRYQPGTAVADGVTANPTYDGLLAIWDAYNGSVTNLPWAPYGACYGRGLPSGWQTFLWSATPFGSALALVDLGSGFVGSGYEGSAPCVAVEVL